MSSPEKFRSRKTLLLACLFVAAILTFQAIRIWVVDYRVHSNRIDQMERGVALEPENASAWDRLGRARETDFVNPDPAGAVADFEKAVTRVPLSATYWMDLAGAYESIGNVPLEREAFSRARAAYPAWRAVRDPAASEPELIMNHPPYWGWVFQRDITTLGASSTYRLRSGAWSSWNRAND